MTKDGKEAKEFAKAIDDLRRELRADLRSLKESTKFCSDTCDKVESIGNDLKHLRKEIQELTKKNSELQNENQRLSQRVEELEHYQRSNNLEIKGVPDEGDPNDVIKKIGDALDEPITNADIDICHRVPTSKPGEKNIIVRFVQRAKRNAVLMKAKKKRLSTEALGFTATRVTTPVFVNEHLTRQCKQLLGATIAKKREVRWKHVWTVGGKVYARKDDGLNILKVTCTADLERMT